MNLREIQDLSKKFNQDRDWISFPPSQVFTHLIEEIGELGRYILYSEGYKNKNLGHKPIQEFSLAREFAQISLLILQLANHYDIDLESSILNELEIMVKRFDAKKWKKYIRSLKVE